ncbi:O-methyltransferase [Chryseobacterium sp. CY353]
MNTIIDITDPVLQFLESHRNTWTDYNIPFTDGVVLEELILKNNSKTILEIGTSSGHSTIWLAKAAEKTGGKVITIEMDINRFEKAERNFKNAGVDHLIDIKLGDAMEIIPTLRENFDFIFSDATWNTQQHDGYINFFKKCEPKLNIGGLFTMHNVTDGYGDDGRFFDYLKLLGNFKTHIIKASTAGISVSEKLY